MALRIHTLTRCGKSFPGFDNKFRVSCVQWRGEQKPQGTPAIGTVIALMHREETATSRN
jgi:hypothetical protein